MKKTDIYREKLMSMVDWDSYLLEESCLPGPRANIELAQAVAEAGDLARFRRYLKIRVTRHPMVLRWSFFLSAEYLDWERSLQKEIFKSFRNLGSIHAIPGGG